MAFCANVARAANSGQGYVYVVAAPIRVSADQTMASVARTASAIASSSRHAASSPAGGCVAPHASAAPAPSAGGCGLRPTSRHARHGGAFHRPVAAPQPLQHRSTRLARREVGRPMEHRAGRDPRAIDMALTRPAHDPWCPCHPRQVQSPVMDSRHQTSSHPWPVLTVSTRSHGSRSAMVAGRSKDRARLSRDVG